MEKFTQERLKELLVYYPMTGIFIWKEDMGNFAKKGNRAGYVHSSGYVIIGLDGNRDYAHRLAWLYVYGYIPEKLIDHIDRKKCNNWIDNLRESSSSCNLINSDIRSDNISGIKGVCWDKRKQKWQALLCKNGKRLFLGYFEKKVDAAKARYEAEVSYNFVECEKNSSALSYITEHRTLKAEGKLAVEKGRVFGKALLDAEIKILEFMGVGG